MEITGGDEEAKAESKIIDDFEQGDDDGDDSSSLFVAANPQHPNLFFVMKRYWKGLVFWSVIVFLLALVATLTPLFVLRDESSTEEQNKALNELHKAEVGIKNVMRLAFIPASSIALWVLREPDFLLPDSLLPGGFEVAEDYFQGNSPFQQACRRALGLVSGQLEPGTIRNLGLAPHGTISGIFPLYFPLIHALGENLFSNPIQRRHILNSIFSNEFTLAGPMTTISGDGLGLAARFPIFYEATNCSCNPSSPTSNTVMYRKAKTFPASFEEFKASNMSLSSLFSFGKLGEIPQKMMPSEEGMVGGGRSFPTEVVYNAGLGLNGEESDLKTMFCDTNPEMGWMGADLEGFGVNTSISFLPKCRFFWGTSNLIFDFELLMRHGGHLKNLEGAGFSYFLTKIGLADEEPVTLSKSSDYSENFATPKRTIIDLPGHTWFLSVVPSDNQQWEGDDWKWQLALAIVGSFLLSLIAFLLVFLVVYRKQYLKNVAAELSDVSSVAMVQKKRAEASEKVAIENEAVAKKFLSTMSHELRTPLNSILAVSELMMLDADRDSPPDQTSALLLKRESCPTSPSPVGTSSTPTLIEGNQIRDFELIHDSACFLKQIVDDVLDFNKIEMGCLIINPIIFSPVMAVQAVARLAKPLIKDPNLYFYLNIDPSTPEKVKADEHRFKQIIMNLAANAIKFIEAGGLTISLSTVCLSSLPLPALSSIDKWGKNLEGCPEDRLREIIESHREGGLFVYVDVEDTGPGMTLEQRRAVFQPFFQSDPGRDVQAGGSGLGLSICSDLCKVMGGVIWATDPMRGYEAVGGKGTSFRFLLPLLEAEGRVSSGMLRALSLNEGELGEGEEEGEGTEREEKEGGNQVVEVAKLGGSSREGEEVGSGRGEESAGAIGGSKGVEDQDNTTPSPPSNAESSPLSPLPCSPSSSSPSILRVLLIDDSSLNRLVFDRMLKSLLPCVVDQAENGEDAMNIVVERGERYDLVVCDLNMGAGKTGVEVGRELKSRLDYPFVMALFTADVMVELGGEEGAFEAVLFKPLSREVLVDFLMKHLDVKFFPKGFPPPLKKKKKRRVIEGRGV